MGVYVFSKTQIDYIYEQLEVMESFAKELIDTSTELRCKLNGNEHSPITEVGD